MRKYFILLFLFFILIFGFFVWQGIYLPKDQSSKIEKIFVIQEGEGTKEIAFHLEKEGLIKSASLFRMYTFFKEVSGQLQAGDYLLSPAMTAPEITEKFVSGKVVKITITIPEGFNLNEIIKKLSENFVNSDRIKELGISSFREDFEFLKDSPKEANLEGFLFPDTYQFSFRAGMDEIVKKMLANFDRKLTQDIREEISLQGKTIFEVITMASLIEKEVNIFEDKKLVSGILWKRRDHDIPLQVDATIVYILSDSEKYPERHITGKKTTKISKEETQIDSPYNTYKYLGLPFGPISNPGLDSILTAVYPEDNPFLYYLSTPEGETIFSKTLEEHNIAKTRYLK